MPHVNLLYPFLRENQLDDAQSKLQRCVSSIPPFQVRFDSFDHFSHKSAVMFLQPTSEPAGSLRALQSALEREYPQCSDLSSKSPSGFHPHMTLGQFPKSTVERKEASFSSSWEPISFVVDRIYIISRTASSPFEIRHTLFLGVGSPCPTIAAKDTPFPAKDTPFPADPPPAAEKFNAFHDVKESVRPTGDLGLVIRRLERWMRNLRDLSHLPKDTYALRRTIRPMCKLKSSIASPQEVISMLVEEEFIRVDEDGAVSYLRKRSPDDTHRPAIVPHRSASARTPDAEVVLERCRRWVQHPGNSPRAESSLANSLSQLCLCTHVVDPDEAIRAMEDMGILTVDGHGNATYNVGAR